MSERYDVMENEVQGTTNLWYFPTERGVRKWNMMYCLDLASVG